MLDAPDAHRHAVDHGLDARTGVVGEARRQRRAPRRAPARRRRSPARSGAPTRPPPNRRGAAARRRRRRERSTTSASSIRPSVMVPVLSSTAASTDLGRLEHLAALDHDAELRAAAGADHDRGRRGETQRARAGDDEHRDRGGERLVGARCRAPARRPTSPPRSRARRARTPPRCGRPGAAPAPSSPAPPRPAARSAPARCRHRRVWPPPPGGPRC